MNRLFKKLSILFLGFIVSVGMTQVLYAQVPAPNDTTELPPLEYTNEDMESPSTPDKTENLNDEAENPSDPEDTSEKEPVYQNEENRQPAIHSEQTETEATSDEKNQQPEAQADHKENEETSTEENRQTNEQTTETPAVVEERIEYSESHFFAGGVSAISVQVQSSYPAAVYFAGNDGYISSISYPDFHTDTWQISRLPIKAIAAHPTLPYIAVSVSDGLSRNEVSVWNWNKKELLYTVKLDSFVVSLSWSAQGNYLFVGNTSISGINVFDKAGNECDIFVTQPGIVLLAATGISEKSVLTYDETGSLRYTKLKTKELPTAFETEAQLKTPIALKNYTRFAGYKNNMVLLCDALSGKTIQRYPAQNPIFASKSSDSIPVWLEKTGKASYCIRQGLKKTPDFDFEENITVAAHLAGNIFVGTEEGNIYILQQQNNKQVAIRHIEPPQYTPIKDIQGFGNKIYALGNNALYLAHEADNNFKLLKSFSHIPIQANRIRVCEDGVFLWSAESKAPIYFYSLKTDKLNVFLRPTEAVLDISCYEKNCLVVFKFHGLKIFTIADATLVYHYARENIQSALQVDAQSILVTKNAVESLQPVYMLNIHTGETLFFPITGIFSYGLRANRSRPTELHCFVVNQDETGLQTLLYEIQLNTKKPLESTVKKVFALNGEVLNAFAAANGNALITNLSTELIGKNNQAYFKLARSYSLVTDASFTKTNFYAHNCDGTISVYDPTLKFIDICKLENP